MTEILILALAVFVGIPLILVIIGIVLYNRLVALRQQVENAWSQIDVQLRRRHDLIPNLVETVKGYAAHERETLESVIAARSRAVQAEGPAEAGQAESQLSGALANLFAVAEQYPDLKANENFLALQEELTSTENRISYARQFYNDSAMTYNTRCEQFPSNIVAGMFRFEKRDFFEIEDPGVRETPDVSFS
jgi:LemA protein